MWNEWWVWVAAGVVLAILEVVIPGFIFLGFAIGAVVVGAMMAVGVSLALPKLLLVFAVVSVIAWIVLRQVVGLRQGQIRRVHHDINEE